MTESLQNVTSQKLNGRNFDDWYLFIKNYLIGKKLFEYSEVDLLSEKITELNQAVTNLHNAQAQMDPNNPNPELQELINNLQLEVNNCRTAMEEARTKDAMVNSIIISNVTNNVLKYIRRLDRASQKMDKLKRLFQRDESEYLSHWHRKLYTLKASNISKTMEVINDIMELFNLLENTTMNPNNWEKLTIMHNALPDNIKNVVNFSAAITPEEFYNDIKNKVSIRNYGQNNNNLQDSQSSSNSANNSDDEMDLDINYVSHKRQFKHRKNTKTTNTKYCHICKKNGHQTDDCYYNSKSKNYSRNRNSKQKSNKKRNHYKRKNVSRDNSVDNIESRDDDCLPYEVMDSMFGDNECNSLELVESHDTYEDHVIDNIDHMTEIKNFSKSDLLNNNNNYYLGNNHTVWTFDTGSSEHIINDKHLLTNFKRRDITMKCANNTECHFEGSGTYFGMINGKSIKLDDVLYSKDITKCIISGIKLIKSGINCFMKLSKDNQALLTLYKNNTLIGNFNANQFNIIKILIQNTNSKNINYDLLNTENIKSNLIWHMRLGHFYNFNINKYLKLDKIKPIKCHSCAITKINKLPFNGTTPKATRILETIHSDIVGPLETSFTFKRYFITFIDEWSRKSWIYLLKDKSEAVITILHFLKFLNNHYENKVKFFQKRQR